MRLLIQDLLEYSQTGTQALHIVPTDLNKVLEDVLQSLQDLTSRAGATITRDRLPEIPADAIKIGQVFQNLVTNAVKFRGDAPPQVHIGARHEDGKWVHFVRDNGIGFEPEYADRIFIMFERLHRRKEFEGSGIGLAIAKGSWRAHLGRERARVRVHVLLFLTRVGFAGGRTLTPCTSVPPGGIPFGDKYSYNSAGEN